MELVKIVKDGNTFSVCVENEVFEGKLNGEVVVRDYDYETVRSTMFSEKGNN